MAGHETLSFCLSGLPGGADRVLLPVGVLLQGRLAQRSCCQPDHHLTLQRSDWAADNNSLEFCVSTAINVHFTDIELLIRSLFTCVCACVIMMMHLHSGKKWTKGHFPHSKFKTVTSYAFF